MKIAPLSSPPAAIEVVQRSTSAPKASLPMLPSSRTLRLLNDNNETFLYPVIDEHLHPMFFYSPYFPVDMRPSFNDPRDPDEADNDAQTVHQQVDYAQAKAVKQMKRVVSDFQSLKPHDYNSATRFQNSARRVYMLLTL